MNKVAPNKAGNLELQIPEVFQPMFAAMERFIWRFIILRGGRGSAKSWTVAIFLILLASKRKVRILCTREFQKTMAESVHKLLSDQIYALGYSSIFKIQKTSIQCLTTGSEFLFVGIRTNVDEIKSMEGIDVCWIEEGQSTSQYSLDVLVPTIRKPDSFIIITFNPYMDSDPVHVMSENPDSRMLVIEANYMHNPFFPEVLRIDMERDKETDYDKYEWVWLGKCKGISAAQIFRGKYRVEAFDTPSNVQFYYGMDFGFANDPAAIVRSFVVGDTLYIDYEAFGVGVELDELPDFCDSVPGIRLHPLPADNSRPETISYLKNKQFNIYGCEKIAIEEGISYLKNFAEIVVHPRCVRIKEEFDLYQYKVEKVSGAILPIPVDRFNHGIDALRYAHLTRMRTVSTGSVYSSFTVNSLVAPFAVAGTVFTATFATPGRTLTVSLALANGALIVIDEYASYGPVDFSKLRTRFHESVRIVWFPFMDMDDVSPSTVQDAIENNIEPAVGNLFPAPGEGIKLINALFKNKALYVANTCVDVINALTHRTFAGPQAELEKPKNINEMTLLSELLEYATWRARGRVA